MITAERKQTYPRAYRLTKTDDFSSVFGFRRAIRGQLLMLHYLPRPAISSPGAEANGTDISFPRLGLVVGKKLLKTAVGRNALKRVVREQFRLSRNELPDCDVVLRLITKTVRVDKAVVAAEVQELFTRLRRQAARGVTTRGGA